MSISSVLCNRGKIKNKNYNHICNTSWKKQILWEVTSGWTEPGPTYQKQTNVGRHTGASVVNRFFFFPRFVFLLSSALLTLQPISHSRQSSFPSTALHHLIPHHNTLSGLSSTRLNALHFAFLMAGQHTLPKYGVIEVKCSSCFVCP